MSDFTYNSFPIPAKPLSGVGETSYLSALLGIAPGGVKKVPTASFLAAAGVYPVALLQCTPQITQVIGDVAANTTLIPLIADTTVSGGDTGVSTGGMSVGESSPNSGKIVISEAGLYRVSCSIRITRTSSDGGECGAVILKNGSSVITSVYDEADTDDHFTLTCPTVIASLASGDVLSLNAAIVGGSTESIYVNGASLLPEDVPTPTSVVLVERLNSASGDSSSSESLAELAAEVQDAREGYDGTEYASLGAAIRGQIGQAMANGIKDSVKQALLQLASKVAYIDDQGEVYYTALYNALYPPIPATAISLSESTLSFVSVGATQQLTATLTPADSTDRVLWSSSDEEVATVSSGGLVTVTGLGTCTITAVAGNVSATCSVTVAQATLSSITATFTQGANDDFYAIDPLDFLKWNLVVTANYSNGASETIGSDSYTLSGTLEVGTSTITVTYQEKTDTFNVTVSANPLPSGYTMYNWVTNAKIVSQSNCDTGLAGTYGGPDYRHDLIYESLNNETTDASPHAIYGCRYDSGSDPTARVLWAGWSAAESATMLSCVMSAGKGYIFREELNKLYKFSSGGTTWKMNNEVVRDDYSTDWTPYTDGHIVLFGMWQGTATYPVRGGYTRQQLKIYRFKVTEISTGTVIANMIPCKNSSGRSGFYDIVRNSFKSSYASGNTNLTAGNVS